MRKIGIITIHNSPNYGASLQAFALYEYIRQQGAEVEIIDLHRPNAHADYEQSKKYLPYRLQKKSSVNQLIITVKKLLYTIAYGKKKAFTMGYYDDALTKFEVFNSVIRMSKPYKSVDAIYADPPVYDVYITGSDQLWNPTQRFCLEPFFLTFVPNNAVKISYASSIGISSLTNIEKNDFKKWLSSYNAISVREKQAQKMLNELLMGKNVFQVSDPTFLLDRDFWKNLAIVPDNREPYILFFPLMHDVYFLEFAIRVAHESGKKLLVVDQKKHMEGSYVLIKDAGPREWLGLIANADLVLSDSFHGTVFSILLSSHNFYSYIAPTNKRGARITDLLETFGLSDHLLCSSLKESYQQLSSNVPSKEIITKIFQCEQEKSRQFLDKYIQ